MQFAAKKDRDITQIAIIKSRTNILNMFFPANYAVRKFCVKLKYFILQYGIIHDLFLHALKHLPVVSLYSAITLSSYQSRCQYPLPMPSIRVHTSCVPHCGPRFHGRAANGTLPASACCWTPSQHAPSDMYPELLPCRSSNPFSSRSSATEQSRFSF